MWAVLFYFCAGVILYSYLGYPVLLYIFSFNRKEKPGFSNGDEPAVSMIIAAYNEEKVIGLKVQNTLALDYPSSKLQIIVAAFGSTDATEAIAASFDRVLVLHEHQRKGKAAAINEAVKQAVHPIIVLTDANTVLSTQTLKQLIAPFADEQTGAVAGEKKVISADGAAVSGEGMYWQYESWLKKQETKFYTVVGAAGELFALRKELFVPVPEQTITDDFFISINVNFQYKKVQYAANAVSTETASPSLTDEWKRKVRIAAGGIQSLSLLGKALNPLLYPLLAFQFFSHRVLRWMFCAPALLFLFLSNLLLVLTNAGEVFLWLMILQILFYIFALIGWQLARNNRSFFLFNIPFYIVFMHAAMLAGIVRYANGQQSVLWEKADR
ncbi:glycosyltransferase family 2 protein [Lacibacter sediminis]|uniref:Glycosyltransferase family 2 protein n=1 Tax=Lacibacter sediminis TaxID=2760713 RepID=A0A7G5XII9_9BACT|nr:glycosyltransferase family 2 protein [Lacibacter sediminis]QNA45292.1 glycosyltransferase family 2 protein [Lacibacter sediminis]